MLTTVTFSIPCNNMLTRLTECKWCTSWQQQYCTAAAADNRQQLHLRWKVYYVLHTAAKPGTSELAAAACCTMAWMPLQPPQALAQGQCEPQPQAHVQCL
jgi:hypothetical protein